MKKPNKQAKTKTNKGVRIRVMVFNVTFNNVSAIPWRSVLLVEETRRKPPTNFTT